MSQLSALASRTEILSGKRIEGAASARLRIDGRSYLNFYGSGYFALAALPEIKDAALRALHQSESFCRQIPSSLGAVEPIFEGVQAQIADIMGADVSLYCASGYLIGMTALAAIGSDVHALFIDEHAHFNLVDAARAAALPTYSFRHCDANALADSLRTHLRPGQTPLVLSDGVFATKGNLPPLADYAACLHPFNGRLLVDESHAFGIVGEKGRGAAELYNVETLCTLGSTLSKAYCAHGAFVSCSREQAERLHHAAVVRGSSAGSPISAAAAAASLEYVRAHPAIREVVSGTAAYFRNRLRSIGLSTPETPSAIVSFEIGDAAHMRALQQRLFAQGIFIYHSTYIGAGPEGTIRCAVFRDHTREDIDRLIEALS